MAEPIEPPIQAPGRLQALLPSLLDTLRRNRNLVLFWMLVCVAMPIWISQERPGWDLDVCVRAMHAIRAGHDPYADDIVIQQNFHRLRALHLKADLPYSYVYSPITLPVLRLAGTLPGGLAAALYWTLYVIAILAAIWAGMQAVEDDERRYLVYFAPIAAFFPGLLANGTVLSGNIAYIVYGAVFMAAIFAWRNRQWRWFYLAVLAASCIKTPFLSLLAIPVLSARRQWLPAAATATTGLLLFAAQPLIWPSLFKNYLQSINLMFSYGRDFGCGLTGIFSDILSDYGIPYSRASVVFYLCYAIPLFGLLLYLSRLFLNGAFSLRRWMPVLFVGVILLNPRIIEYDAAPITLPLAVIGWRLLTSITTPRRALLALAPVFLIANGFALHSWKLRKMMDCPLLILIFAMGSWDLIQSSRQLQDIDGQVSESSRYLQM